MTDQCQVDYVTHEDGRVEAVISHLGIIVVEQVLINPAYASARAKVSRDAPSQASERGE